jgi:hypothetical protein
VPHIGKLQLPYSEQGLSRLQGWGQRLVTSGQVGAQWLWDSSEEQDFGADPSPKMYLYHVLTQSGQWPGGWGWKGPLGGARPGLLWVLPSDLSGAARAFPDSKAGDSVW